MRRRMLAACTAVAGLACSLTVTAPASAATSTLYLGDGGLFWQSNSQGYGYTHLNRNIDGGPLMVAGTKYLKGLGAHSNSSIVYNLGGAATRFQSVVGLNTESGATAGTVVFQVFKDDVKVYDSGVMNRSSAAKSVDVDLTGAQRLKLVITDAGDGNSADHANWADARLAVTQGVTLPAASAPVGDVGPDPANPKGDPYDATVNGYPERPYMNDYSQVPINKIYLSQKLGPDYNTSKVYLNFAQALDAIKKLDNMMLGADKIVYLVGWQNNGHDSKYPSWAAVNEDLKRPEDATALESLRWLMREARKYHTKVSLHINMLDAYQDSPLWDTYMAEDIIGKNLDGTPRPGELADGQQSYQVDYKQEWLKGRAQQRIDGLLAMIPELKDAGTVHIDAFHSVSPLYPTTPISPKNGFTLQEELATQRTIMRYWRSKGLDVTTEYDYQPQRRPDYHLGLEPVSWRTNYPSDSIWKTTSPDLRAQTVTRSNEDNVKNNKWNLVEGVAVRDLTRWYYNNNTSREVGAENHGSGNDVFYPVLWRDKAIAAFSSAGYSSRTWTLPPGWSGITTVDLYDVAPEGPRWLRSVPVVDGTVTFGLGAEQGVTIVPTVGASSNAPVGQTVTLKAASNGKQVTARTDQTDAPLRATATATGDTEKFDVVDFGNGYVGLKNRANGKFVVAQADKQDSPLVAKSNVQGNWEKFRWVDLGNGRVALQSFADSRFVTARGDDPESPLRATGWDIGGWEQFTWTAA
ncbi:NPCBM/NEW2 domain-containing protein [Kitasatospora purpeofusca]|uniref:NPCBM/NEW2 domain-containing protein n=1 Tax=Kitasatospora purpeofusca TaxID=67352 RepID=UPI0035E07DDD